MNRPLSCSQWNILRKGIDSLSKPRKRFVSEHKRKYPVNPKHEKELPVFEYKASTENYKKVFSWGNSYTGALGEPFSSKNGEKFSQFPKRLSFGERYEVTSMACGFGFTVFAVTSKTNRKIYGTGINTDSQIGYHEVRKGYPLEIIYIPKPIDLPFRYPEISKIIKLAAGRAHLLVLTDEGLFTLGNNSYGQCGREIIDEEQYGISNHINKIEELDGKKITDVECGQDHSLALTEDGTVYACGWGADGQTGLEHFNNSYEFTRVKGDIQMEKIVKLSSRSDFVLALNEKGEVFGWGNTEYGQMTLPGGDQQISTPSYIKMLEKLGKITSVAAAGSFCLVLNNDGQVYSWGYGLLGTSQTADLSRDPIYIPKTLFGKNDYQPDSRVNKVACGLYHAAALTNSGDLYTWGRNKSGCLGLGHSRDQFFPIKVSVGGYVEQINCGLDHTAAICKPFI